MLTAADLAAPGAAPVRQPGGPFAFTEGPVWDNAGALYFSDGFVNRAYRYAEGACALFREETRGGNGMALAHDGRLLVCEGGGNRLSAVDTATLAVETLADSYDGRPLNAPNDLALDRAGGVYFTDPYFPATGQRPIQDAEAVYYLPSGGGALTRVWSGDIKPNGVVLTADERTLLVADSFGKHVWAVELSTQGAAERAYPWGALAVPPTAYVAGPGGAPVLLEGYPEATLADGMALDAEGRLFVAAQQGVQVLDPDGALLGVLEFPEQPANCCFGGENLTTLFVTAQHSVYALEMRTTGLRLPLA
ncbi:MAG: SMP-30/gluconolactonase/LRE family protein [Chloroflexota bacterium]|nr:SMP-30/gluconolactonase/LRE family protein [Chloroflexota bacterium]